MTTTTNLMENLQTAKMAGLSIGKCWNLMEALEQIRLRPYHPQNRRIAEAALANAKAAQAKQIEAMNQPVPLSAWQQLEAERDLLKRQIEELQADLQFIERVAVHHGTKPHMTAAMTLSTIQHYPAITQITKGYANGKVPETVNPWEQIEALQADAELGRIAMRFVDRAGDVADCDPAERICAEFYKAMGDAIDAHCAATTRKGNI